MRQDFFGFWQSQHIGSTIECYMKKKMYLLFAIVDITWLGREAHTQTNTHGTGNMELLDTKLRLNGHRIQIELASIDRLVY